MTIALVGAVLVALMVAAWNIAASRHRPLDRAAGDALATREPSSSTETSDLQRQLRRLEGQVAALQLNAARAQTPSGSPSAAAPEDRRPAQEVQRGIRNEHFRRLEGLLMTDATDASARSAESAAIGELSSALGNKGRVAAVKCTTTFCRIVIEEDDEKGEGVNIPLLAQSTPSLRHEALYDHEQLGVVKRTIIYVARASQQLPLSRAAGPAEGSGADVSAPL